MKQLGELQVGQSGRIVGFSGGSSGANADSLRLMQMGLIEGALVEVLHQAPWSGDPIAIRVRGALIALRREEANQVRVILE